jgi:hypothetical protein
METASANQAVKIDVKRQSKGPLSYAYLTSRASISERVATRLGYLIPIEMELKAA